MMDPRYERLAEVVLDHYLALKPGQVLRIEAEAVAAPLFLPLHREAIKRGAHAYAAIDLGGLKELLVAHGSEDQLSFVSPIALRSETNTRSFSRADAERRKRQLAADQQLAMRRRDRISRGEIRWCGTL